MSIYAFIVRRLFVSFGTILIITVVVFSFLHLLPGDPAQMILGGGTEGGTINEEQLQRIRQELNLDKPLHIQYFLFLKNALQGNLGKSYYNDQPVSNVLLIRFQRSFELVILSFLLAVPVGISLGVLAGIHSGRYLSTIIVLLSVLGISLPVYVLGPLFIKIFSLQLSWLPTSGYVLISESTVKHIQSLVLPVTTLSLGLIAMISRIQRSSLLEVLHSEYITTARSKGLNEGIVMTKHALRNAVIPVISIGSVQLARLVGGTVVLETVFTYPGLGLLLKESIMRRDLPVILGIALLVGITFSIINLLVDLAYCFLDPRIRYD